MQILNTCDTRSRRDCRSGAISLMTIVSVAILLLVMSGVAFLLLKPGERTVDQPLTMPVQRGVFIAEVLDQGEIQSSDNVEFRCDVKSRYSNNGIAILEVVDEGIMVNEGDVLIRLDSAAMQAQLEEQKIAVVNSSDEVKAAENRLKVAQETFNEYLNGVFEADKLLIENNILLAREDTRKAEDYYRYSQRLAAKRYITDDQLQADKFAVQRAENALKLAEKQLMVLEQITKVKMLGQFQSEIDIAESKLDATKKSLAIEERQMAEVEEQIGYCTISVPPGVSGQVTYANVFSHRGSSEWILEPGSTVREKQVMIRLPNRDLMQVRAAVNESRITSIKTGMPVEVQVDALGQRTLDGVVSKVNQYAEPDGWGGGGVKKYAVYIDIKKPPMEIRPGMNAAVKIQIARHEDAIMAPMQTVYGVGKRTFCMVKTGDRWETREINVEMSNDKQVLISSGVDVGDQLAMSPGNFRNLMELPADALEELKAASKTERQNQAELEEQAEEEGPGGETGGRPGAEPSRDRDGKGERPGGPGDSKSNSTESDDSGESDSSQLTTSENPDSESSANTEPETTEPEMTPPLKDESESDDAAVDATT